MAYRMTPHSPGAEPAPYTTTQTQPTLMELLDAYQGPSRDLLEGVLPATPDYSGPQDNVSLHLNIAAHSRLLVDALRQDDDHRCLDYGMVNPNEAAVPLFSSRDDSHFNSIEELANLSLQDVENILQFSEGHFSFESHSTDTSASLSENSQDRYTSPCSTQNISPHQPMGSPNQHTTEQVHYASPSFASTVNYFPNQNLLESYSYSTPTPFPHPQNHSNGDDLFPETAHQLATTDTRLLPSNDLLQETAFSSNSLDYLQQQSLRHSYQSSREVELSSVVVPVNSNSSNTVHSRKGYTHRHQRVYGLSEEDQKKRNKELNNEASQLYRQRKSTNIKQLQAQERQEQERKKELVKKYQKLCRQIELYKRSQTTMDDSITFTEHSTF
ncbi:uncharacterized protein LOC135199805 [Macrobrachium nipponense]|uniref:uncharacterized protein LOC135199805 n=1 Tax=Macrobrachium nipponense TaxID=159736 RepID=UPI0030C8B5DC